jgi:H+/Cl- antiporter ClcA
VLPVQDRWYRRLLSYSLVLGLVTGSLALAYMLITNFGINRIFASDGIGFWSGRWWWIPFIAGGALIVTLLRKAWSVPEHLPGAVAQIEKGWVDPRLAPRVAILSGLSLILGASLGPSFGLIFMGGGLGTWLISRIRIADPAEKQVYPLVGMAGGMGGAFTAPLFSSILTSELSPTGKKRYVAFFIPQLIAATVGFIVFWGVTKSTMLDNYAIDTPAFTTFDLVWAVALGLFAAFVLLVFVMVDKVVARGTALIKNVSARAVIAGGLVGFIGFAVPLTLNSGATQLADLVTDYSTLGIALLAAALLGKMLAVSLSLSAGFLGGNVFPFIFIGGTSGVLIHLLFQQVPLGFAVAAMMAGVPGAFLSAPISMTLVAAGTVAVGPQWLAPIALTVVTAYITFSAIQVLVKQRKQAKVSS